MFNVSYTILFCLFGKNMMEASYSSKGLDFGWDYKIAW
jgi:hypothetical protein